MQGLRTTGEPHMQAQSVQSATCLSSITLHLCYRWLIDTLDYEGNTIQTDRSTGGCCFASDRTASCRLPATPSAVLRQYVDSKYCRAVSGNSSRWGFCMHVLARHVAECHCCGDSHPHLLNGHSVESAATINTRQRPRVILLPRCSSTCMKSVA